MWHELKEETILDHPIDKVFRFFSDAENLERITPDSLGFNITTERPIQMRLGTLIDYRLRINGIPVKWRTEITCWDPPHAFEDTQIKGPYKDWIHRHTFESLDGGRTRMRDHVRYRLPLTPLGDIAYPLIARQVRGIFRHRGEAIKRELQ